MQIWHDIHPDFYHKGTLSPANSQTTCKFHKSKCQKESKHINILNKTISTTKTKASQGVHKYKRILKSINKDNDQDYDNHFLENQKHILNHSRGQIELNHES